MTYKQTTILAFFISAFIVMITGAYATASETIAAVVNDDVVTISELEARTNLAIQSSGLPNNQDVKRRLKNRVLNQLIEETLQIQEAKRLEYDIDKKLIHEQMSQIADKNAMDLDKFAQVMRHDDINPATLARQVEAQIAWSQVVQRRIRPQVNISETDIQAQISQLQSNVGKTEFLVAEIFIPVATEDQEQDAKALSNELYKELSSGRAKYPELARQFSKSPGAARGGVIGWVLEGQLPDTLNITVRQMEPQTISAPVQSDNGYHILLLQQKRTVDVEENKFVLRDQVTNTLGQERLQAAARRYLENLKAAAFIERRA